MPNTHQQTQKILSRFKGLNRYLEPGEEPLLSLPAIWDSGQTSHGETCEVIVTNQRVIGFYFRSFPREKLFLDTLQLSRITTVTLRQKSYEPIFRELLVAERQRKVYIRAPRRQIETLYTALRCATSSQDQEPTPTPEAAPTDAPAEPVYGRQEMRAPFENSPLAITLLFTGGIILEIIGILAWSGTHSASIGFPLCIAGFVAVCTAIYVQRQRRRSS